jgi:endonuclease YncB( thermonuclease family)
MLRSALLLLILMTGAPAHADQILGRARAIDGDSLKVGETEVRLHGIDAPLLSQTCQRGGRDWSCGLEPRISAPDMANGEATGLRLGIMPRA